MNLQKFALGDANRVVAVELDEKRAKMIENNAKVYQCDGKLEVICQDFLEFSGPKFDAVFLSPPWGGIDY